MTKQEQKDAAYADYLAIREPAQAAYEAIEQPAWAAYQAYRAIYKPAYKVYRAEINRIDNEPEKNIIEVKGK